MSSVPKARRQDGAADSRCEPTTAGTIPALPSDAKNTSTSRQTEDQRKSSEEFQRALWAQWTTPEAWPYRMDLYEAAGYLRVSPATLRRAVETDSAGRARLAHQRILSAYRFRRPDLDAFGLVSVQPKQTQAG